MNERIKVWIIPIIIAYLLIAALLSFQMANLFFAFTILGIFFIPKKESQETEKKMRLEDYIKGVPKNLVLNNNTLYNDYCITRYIPNSKKIIVMVNPRVKDKPSLRLFTVDKTNCESVERCWEKICSVFDEYITFDTLYSFIDKSSKTINIAFITKETNDSVLKDMKDFIPENHFKESEKAETVKSTKNKILEEKIEESSRNNQAIIVDFEDFSPHKIDSDNKGKKDYDNYINMNSLSNSDKIDINLADEETLADLPGIDSATAKRIVEYRNQNGFFKTKEEFSKISGLTPASKDKIFEMITNSLPKKS